MYVNVENVNFAYDKKPILHDINFGMNKGEITGLIGPNGAGKSTMLKLMIKKMKPNNGKIIIGDNVLIAPNVQIYTAYHPTHYLDRFTISENETFNFCKTQTAPVIIGKNVWIGGGTIILPGVTIGDNTVIGAGSVVTKDIPADTIAYGNPCKVHKANERSKSI